MNETRLVTAGQADLVETYTEMVAAFARLFRSQLLDDGKTVRTAVIDHLDRLTEARTGLMALSVLDVVDRLYGELTQDSVRVDPLGFRALPHKYEALALGGVSRNAGSAHALRAGRLARWDVPGQPHGPRYRNRTQGDVDESDICRRALRLQTGQCRARGSRPWMRTGGGRAQR